MAAIQSHVSNSSSDEEKNNSDEVDSRPNKVVAAAAVAKSQQETSSSSGEEESSDEEESDQESVQKLPAAVTLAKRPSEVAVGNVDGGDIINGKKQKISVGLNQEPEKVATSLPLSSLSDKGERLDAIKTSIQLLLNDMAAEVKSAEMEAEKARLKYNKMKALSHEFNSIVDHISL